MSYKTGILLGQITKVIGFEGAVALKQEKILSDRLPYREPVYIEIEGRPVPFFIVEYDHLAGDLRRLKFEGYDKPGKVGEFVGCRVFLTRDIPVENEEKDWQILKGYSVSGSGLGNLGKVENVIQNPGQWLLEVRSLSGRLFLIPLHINLIISIDKKKKQLEMEIPAGLTEIN